MKGRETVCGGAWLFYIVCCVNVGEANLGFCLKPLRGLDVAGVAEVPYYQHEPATMAVKPGENRENRAVIKIAPAQSTIARG